MFENKFEIDLEDRKIGDDGGKIKMIIKKNQQCYCDEKNSREHYKAAPPKFDCDTMAYNKLLNKNKATIIIDNVA